MTFETTSISADLQENAEKIFLAFDLFLNCVILSYIKISAANLFYVRKREIL